MASPLDQLEFSPERDGSEATSKVGNEVFTLADPELKQTLMDGEEEEEGKGKHGNKFISRASLFEEHFPQQIKDFPATAAEKRKMPHLLYWRKYGDYKPEPVFGPAMTAKEEWGQISDRIQKKEKREHLAKTRKEIQSGKQPKLTNFFGKTGNVVSKKKQKTKH